MAKLGMDDQAVRALASQLDGHAKAIAGLVGQIEGVVSRMRVSWHGDDAEDFVGWWHNQHRPALQRTHDSIAGLAQSARNNATDQDRASATSTVSAASTASTAGVAARAATQEPGVSAQATTNAGYAAEFKTAMRPGTVVGDGQCVQVFEAYNTSVVHGKFVGVGANGGAREFYERYDSLPYLSTYYDKIPPSSPPQAGDVVVWGAAVGGGYGHIAVCTGSHGSSFDVVEQNAPEGAPVRDGTYTSTVNVIGYLRPKQAT